MGHRRDGAGGSRQRGLQTVRDGDRGLPCVDRCRPRAVCRTRSLGVRSGSPDGGLGLASVSAADRLPTCLVDQRAPDLRTVASRAGPGAGRRGQGLVRAVMTLEGRPVARTSLIVTSVGCGGASLGNLYCAMDDEQAAAVVDAAWDSGI